MTYMLIYTHILCNIWFSTRFQQKPDQFNMALFTGDEEGSNIFLCKIKWKLAQNIFVPSGTIDAIRKSNTLHDIIKTVIKIYIR